jgi:hypothetical protein
MFHNIFDLNAIALMKWLKIMFSCKRFFYQQILKALILKTILLTIISENQMHKPIAEAFAGFIQKELGKGWELTNISKYHKFDNSFAIEFRYKLSVMGQNEINMLAISLTDKLVSPWLLYFNNDDNSIELVYNKSDTTQKKNSQFEAIKWGHLQMVD